MKEGKGKIGLSIMIGEDTAVMDDLSKVVVKVGGSEFLLAIGKTEEVLENEEIYKELAGEGEIVIQQEEALEVDESKGKSKIQFTGESIDEIEGKVEEQKEEYEIESTNVASVVEGGAIDVDDGYIEIEDAGSIERIGSADGFEEIENRDELEELEDTEGYIEVPDEEASGEIEIDFGEYDNYLGYEEVEET